MSCKFAIFDFDGTIANTENGVLACVQYALESFGRDVPDYDTLKKFLGPPLVVSFMEYIGVDMLTAEKMTAKYRELYSDNAMYILELFDGIEDMLKKLRENGVSLAIASSKPQMYLDKLLDHLKIADYFNAVCGETPDDKGNGKKWLILKACEILGVRSKDDIIMIGDRRFDIEGAKEAGIKSIGVTFGFGEREELEKAGADYIADTPDDILFTII